jgi:hypothetical protein
MTTTLTGPPLTSTLEIGVGFASAGRDAVARAAAAASSGLRGASADLALVVTAGLPVENATTEARSVLGRVQIAGGGTGGILTDDGLMKAGALVVCVANADGAASGVAATCGRNLADAGQAAARLVLSGWPFRARYPRGLGIAFARPDAGDGPLRFLDAWRDFMGPKMRTVCGTFSSALYGGSLEATPRVSVACVEASYATGLGWSDAAAIDGSEPKVEALLHGAADATVTAVKRLDGRPARLVLALTTLDRQRRLGSAAAEEWAAIRAQLEENTPCAGWLVDDLGAYGRGVQPVAAPGALVVVALGDAPRG